MYKVAIFELC